ncbi:MAG: 23S rRNA (uracil(1939)-C(5))-methyltransferase RlmD [Alphaproteobacteria bacterium]|nr:23S rRNA (uracil(1939)-C(5))-methyltransferase RlmD [Alphaproteobacteria bacterium]
MTTRLTISHLGHHGDGLAQTEQGLVDIPYTLAGEEVVVELTQLKDHLHGKVMEITKPSPLRTTPPCPVFGECGGCRLQHLNDATYREWKLGVVNHLLEKNGFTIKSENLFVTPSASRRRVTFTAAKNAVGLQFGFHKRESHDIVSIDGCPVIRPELARLIQPLKKVLDNLLQPNEALSIQATVLNGAIELVFSGKSFSENDDQSLISWAIAHEISRVYTKPDDNAENRILLNQTALTAHFGETDVMLQPAAFMQASDEAKVAMLNCIKPFFKSSKQITDLFCGTGMFALSLHDKSKTMLAVDVDGAAIDTLHTSTQNLRGFKTMRRNLFREPFKAIELKNIDAICLDPPRAGAKEQAVELARSKIGRIAYVSCNPITFMRDARILTDGGYKLLNVEVFDQFLWSHHIELIGFFSR